MKDDDDIQDYITDRDVNNIRNQTLEEVAKEFDKMPFGDTSASFAIYVRNMKNEWFRIPSTGNR
jgi:hypothetical protein